MGPFMPMRGGCFEAGVGCGEFRSDVEWLVPVDHALLHAAGENVWAGRIDSETALHALTTTMLAALAPPSRFAAAASDLGITAIRRFGAWQAG
jgi:hypothetical protein